MRGRAAWFLFYVCSACLMPMAGLGLGPGLVAGQESRLAPLEVVLWAPVQEALRQRLDNHLADLSLMVRVVDNQSEARDLTAGLALCQQPPRPAVVFWIAGQPEAALEMNIVQCKAEKVLTRSFVPAHPDAASRSANLEAVALSLRGSLQAVAAGYGDEVFAPAPFVQEVVAARDAGRSASSLQSSQRQAPLTPPSAASESTGPALGGTRTAGGRSSEPVLVSAPAVAAAAPQVTDGSLAFARWRVGFGVTAVWEGLLPWGWQGAGVQLGGRLNRWLSWGVAGAVAPPRALYVGPNRLLLTPLQLMTGPAVCLYENVPRALWLRAGAGIMWVQRRTRSVQQGTVATVDRWHGLGAVDLALSYEERLWDAGPGRRAEQGLYAQLELGALWTWRRLVLRSEGAQPGGDAGRRVAWPVQPLVKLGLLWAM